MSKFIAERVFKLDFLGESWKECFITFSSVSIKEARELVQNKLGTKTPEEVIDITLAFFQKHFISGNAYDSETKEIIALKAEDFENLPSIIQEKAIVFLVGGTEA